jgi:hypothetical protein
MRRTTPRSPGFTTLAVVAAALHVATAVVVPVLHAQAEVLQSAQEIEASHSAQCPRLHADGNCVVWPSFQLAPPAGACVGDPHTHDRSPLAPATLVFRPQNQGSRSHPVRAPPSR